MMKVKDLKEIIKDLPDDLDVIIVNDVDSDDFPMVEVTSCAKVYAKFEDHDALAFLSSRVNDISFSVKSIGGYDSDLLYDNPPEGGYPNNSSYWDKCKNTQIMYDEEMVSNWINEFKSSGKSVEVALEEAKVSLSNERIWQNGSNTQEQINTHEQNMINLDEYIRRLKELE